MGLMPGQFRLITTRGEGFTATLIHGAPQCQMKCEETQIIKNMALFKRPHVPYSYTAINLSVFLTEHNMPQVAPALYEHLLFSQFSFTNRTPIQ